MGPEKSRKTTVWLRRSNARARHAVSYLETYNAGVNFDSHVKSRFEHFKSASKMPKTGYKNTYDAGVNFVALLKNFTFLKFFFIFHRKTTITPS